MRYPEATVPKLTQAPAIDGTVDNSEWAGALELSLSALHPNGISDGRERHVYLAYDDNNLYLAVSIQRPPNALEPRMPAETGRIDNDSGGDLAELMFAPGRNFDKSFVFMLYSNGAFADATQAGSKEYSWDANLQAASRLNEMGWEGEMAIPFADMGLQGPPTPDEVWGFDAVDNQQTPARQRTHWSYRGHWKDFENAGSIRFAPVPAAHMAQTGEIAVGTLGASFSVLNETGLDTQVSTTMQLLKRKEGAQGGPKSFLENIESGMAHDSQAEFTKGVDLDSQVKFALSFYDPIGETVQESTTVPNGQQRSFGLKQEAELGEYLLLYSIHSGKDVLLRGASVMELEPPLSLEIEPYWLYSQVLDVKLNVGRLEMPDRCSAALSLAAASDPDKALTTAQADVPPGKTLFKVPVDIKGLEPGFYILTARINGPDGEQIAETDVKLERPPFPDWYQNDFGNERVVSEDWTPLEASPNGIVKVWNRIYDLSTFLPKSLTSGGVDVLASPVQLKTVINAKAQNFSVKSLKLVSADEGKATYEARLESADAILSGTVSIEFDGFTWYSIDLSPKKPGQTLDSVTLEAQIVPQFSELFGRHKFIDDPVFGPPNPALNSQPGIVQHSQFPFTPLFWIGEEEGGLIFSAESMQDWSVDKPNAVMETLPSQNGSPSSMMIHYVQKPVPFDRTRHFEFSIQGTPIKEPLKDHRKLFIVQFGGVNDNEEAFKKIADAGAYAVVFYYGWRGDPKTEMGGTPERPVLPGQDEKLRRGVELAHKYGLKVIMFSGWGINAVSPNWQKYGYELGAYPISNKGWGTYTQAAGLNGGYGDFMAWGHADLAREYGVDGVLYDSLGNLTQDTNLRAGNGWVDDQGRVRPTYAVRATRDVYRRIYNIYKGEVNQDGFIYNHGGSMWNINAFADLLNRGEGRPMRAATLREAWIPFEEYRAEYSGTPFGLLQSNDQNDHKKLPMSVNNHNAVSLLHGTFPKTGRIYDQPKDFSYDRYRRPDMQIWQLLDYVPLDGTQKEFLYYEDTEAVVPENPALLSSAFVSPDGRRAAIVVSNLDAFPVNGQAVRINRDVMGLVPGQLKIIDAVTLEEVPVEDDTVTLDILDERYRLLKLTVEDSSSANAG